MKGCHYPGLTEKSLVRTLHESLRILVRECHFWNFWEKDIRKRGVTWWGVTTHQASTGKGVGKGCPAPLPVPAWRVVTPHHVTHKVKHLFLKLLKYICDIPRNSSLISTQNITLCCAWWPKVRKFGLKKYNSQRSLCWARVYGSVCTL